MHRYTEIEKSFEAVKDGIEAGLGQAKLTLQVLNAVGLTDISNIRVCSFNFDRSLHIEVRWDWEKDKLALCFGYGGKIKDAFLFKGDLGEAVRKLSDVVLSVCRELKTRRLMACVLGD